MPRGQGIYRDEHRDKLKQNLDAMKTREISQRKGGTAPEPAEDSDAPTPLEPPD